MLIKRITNTMSLGPRKGQRSARAKPSLKVSAIPGFEFE